MFSPLLLVAAFIATFHGVNGQATTSVTCTTAQWSFNSQGKSPCQVAADLQAVCNGGRWNINPLPLGAMYSGPKEGQSTPCTCSSVVYSLVAACGTCQGGSALTWNLWTANCTASDISDGKYPLSIPTGTLVPAWAYLNISDIGIWDPTRAETFANANSAPESSASPIPSSTEKSTSTESAGGISSSKGSSNAGAIAGGVVGGVIFLVLVVLGALFFIRRRKNRVAPSSEFLAFHRNNEKSPPLPPTTPALPMQNPPPKLYDPSDPSTFPPSPAPTYLTYPSASPYPMSHGHSDSMASTGYASPVPLLSNNAMSPNNRSMGYSGIPEV